MNRRARIALSNVLLQKVFGLPEDVCITGVEEKTGCGTFVFTLVGNSLPEVPEGSIPPIATDIAKGPAHPLAFIDWDLECAYKEEYADDPEVYAKFKKPWAVRYPNGHTIYVDTEEEASEMIYAHREAVGANPTTGDL